MKTIESILNSVPDKIYERGEDYYRFGNIIEMTKNNCDYFAIVEGSDGESYDVNVEIDRNGNVKSFDCSCPYDYSPVCKHIVAVMLAIKNGECKNNNSIANSLNMLSKDELINILADLARDDYKTREKLNKKLDSKSNTDYDVLSVIDCIIDEYSDYDGYVDYYSCYDMCMEIVDAIKNEYDCFKRDNSLKHIHNFMCINRKLIEIMDCCDDSDGGLSIALSENDEKLYSSCMAIYNSKNKDNSIACLDMLCTEAENKSYDYWLESKFQLLHIAVLFSEYNPKLVLKAIEGFINQCKNDNEYYLDKAILLKYQFLIQTENKDIADRFILNHTELDGVCEYLIKQYIDDKKYEEAEELCHDKLNNTELPNKWNNLLSDVYGKSEQLANNLILNSDVC